MSREALQMKQVLDVLMTEHHGLLVYMGTVVLVVLAAAVDSLL